MPRFVVLEHAPGAAANRGLHWDLMLETGTHLRTWALDTLPAAGEIVSAVPLADHRLLYLDYEGPLSDDRGTVTRWDEGTYELVRQSERELLLNFAGRRLIGSAELSCLPDEPQRWRFIWSGS